MAKKHIIITAGDPLGIGPEITVKALKKFKNAAQITVIGDGESLLAAGWRDDMGVLIDIQSPRKKPLKRGPSEWGGDISFKALLAAITLINAGRADALLTAPVSKEAWGKAGVKFTGHTEVLKKYASAKNEALMMFTSGPIHCALVSKHYPIKTLPEILTKERILTAAKIFAGVLGKKAEIAVSAFNPHAGDGGKTGTEEIKIITPAVKELKKQGYKISGPYPIDSLWQKHAAGKYDGILCMYHDQALLGLKLAAKQPVIHITAGLKFLRVSPAHGTAFDIAGKNIADAGSMFAALNFAARSK